jgi:hypothetical protein
MTQKQRELYDYLKKRYDLYLQDAKTHNLLMYILSDEQADTLEKLGFGRKEILMRAETPAVLKALEEANTVEEISLF